MAASPDRTARRARWLLVAAALGFSFTGAFAHVLDVGYLRLHADGARVHVSLDIAAPLAQQLAQLPPLSGTISEGQAGAALGATLGSGPLTRNGKPCRFGPISGKLDGERLALEGDAECDEEAGPLVWSLPFLEKTPLTFRLLGQAQVDDKETEFALEPGQEHLSLEGAAHHGFWEFVLMGVRHIGATPAEWQGKHGFQLPAGLDHILFLLALILCDVSLIPTLKAVTGFTLGHSVTLALATLNIVRLPSRLTESAIALSIAYVAGEDFWASGALRKAAGPHDPKHRWQIAAAFGLVHGFGFASALTELHLSRTGTAKALLGFNLGVELGQELIVVIIAPLLWLLYRNARIKRFLVPAGAAAIFVAGSVWFVQRAFLLGGLRPPSIARCRELEFDGDRGLGRGEGYSSPAQTSSAPLTGWVGTAVGGFASQLAGEEHPSPRPIALLRSGLSMHPTIYFFSLHRR